MRYPQIVRTVCETPWAILPSTLATIQAIIARHDAGETFTAEEIKAAVSGRPSTRQPEAVGTVAILPLYGVLMPRADLMSQMSGATSLEAWGAAFQQLLAMDEVGAIVIDIDSPGGSTYLVPETAQLIHNARGQGKPIIAVANAVACSAAYWLGCQADEFWGTDSAVIGSVGVIAAHTDISVAQEKAGIKTTVITYGANKADLSPYEPLSDDARARLQERIDAFGDMFVSDVAAGRGVSTDAVDKTFGQGAVFAAHEAATRNMIDGIATREELVARLLEETSAPAQSLGARPRALAITACDDTTESYVRIPVTTTTTEAAQTGLSFEDEARAARDAVKALVGRTLSLAEVRRGRLTATKRKQLTAIADSLTSSAKAITTLLASTEPNDHIAALDAEVIRFEAIRATS